MVFLLQLVRKYEVWLYGLCGLVLIYYVRRAWQARRLSLEAGRRSARRLWSSQSALKTAAP